MRLTTILHEASSQEITNTVFITVKTPFLAASNDILVFFPLHPGKIRLLCSGDLEVTVVDKQKVCLSLKNKRTFYPIT